MPTIDVEDETYEQLAFAARVFGVSIAEVVARLVHGMQTAAEPTAKRTPPPVSPENEDDVAIHAVYQNRRITGFFRQSTAEVRITSDPLVGRIYSSASAAAVAVVEKINPGRAYPHTNGRTFWIVDKTNRNLRSLIGRR
jgi:hypothetical protein